MKKIFSILSAVTLVAMLSVGCRKELTPDPPIIEGDKPLVDFIAERADSVDYQSYKFNGTAENYESLLWQFGDDSTSTELSPSHKYVFDGEYMVRLTIRNENGFSATKEVILDVADPNFDPTKVGENYFQTVKGKFSVSRDNGGGPNANEGSLKVVDGDNNTKFFQSGFAGDLVMKFELDTAKVAGAYTLVSGNDSPDRDPKRWILAGSEDDIKWITLHTVNNGTFSGRNQRKLMFFNNNVAYKYYRLSIKTNNGSRDFQMSEWTVNKKQP